MFKRIAVVSKQNFDIISRGANQAREKRFDVFFQETKIEISTRQHGVAHSISLIQAQHSFQDCNKDASFLKTKLDLEKAHYLFYLPIPELGDHILTVLQQMPVGTTTPEAIHEKVEAWVLESLNSPLLPSAIKQDLTGFLGRKYEANAYLFWQEQQCLLVDDFNGNVTDFFELQQQQFKALLAIAETPEEKAALFALKSNEMRDLLYSHRLDVRSPATCSWFETMLGLKKQQHADSLFEDIKTILQSPSPHRDRAHAVCDYLLKYEITPSISVYEDMGKLLLDTDSPKTVLMWRNSANAWASRTLTALFEAAIQLDVTMIQSYVGALLHHVETLHATGSERERFSKTIAGYADLINYANGCVTYIATHLSDRFTKHDFKAMCHDFLLYRSLQHYAERDIQKAANPFDSVNLAKQVCVLESILPQVQLQVLQYADLVTQAEFLTFGRYLSKNLSGFSEKKSLVSAFKHMVIQDYLPSNRVQNTAFLLFGNLFSLKGDSPEQIHHWLKSSVLSEEEADITQSICSLMPSEVAIPLIVKQLTEAHPLQWGQRLAAIESDAVFNHIREKHCEFPERISVFSEQHNTYFSSFMQTLNYNYFAYIGALVDARKTMMASTADQSEAESILRLSYGLQKIKEAIIENSNDILPQNPRHWKSIFKEILGSKIEGVLTNAGLLFLLKIAREHSDSLYERLGSDVSAEAFLRGLVKHVLFGHSKAGIESACHAMLDRLPLACVLELGSAYQDNAAYNAVINSDQKDWK